MWYLKALQNEVQIGLCGFISIEELPKYQIEAADDRINEDSPVTYNKIQMPKPIEM